jgi:leader peptidase (prepilin peptidase)/N-methyltransferase
VEFVIAALWAQIASGPLPDVPTDHLPTSVLIYAFATKVLTMILIWFLVALAILDAENLWLPNFLTVTGTAIGFVSTAADPFVLLVLTSGTGIPFTEEFEHERFGIWTPALSRLVAILAAGGLILLIRWTYWFVRRREGIGLGDAKLMAMLGAWLGLSGALLSFAIGVMLGAVFALVILAVPAARRESDTWLLSKLPLGTFLCIGGIVSALWGQPIIAAYLRWVGLS